MFKNNLKNVVIRYNFKFRFMKNNKSKGTYNINKNKGNRINGTDQRRKSNKNSFGLDSSGQQMKTEKHN